MNCKTEGLFLRSLFCIFTSDGFVIIQSAIKIWIDRRSLPPWLTPNYPTDLIKG